MGEKILAFVVFLTLLSIPSALACTSDADCGSMICDTGLGTCVNPETMLSEGYIEISNIQSSACNGQLVDVTIHGVYPISYYYFSTQLGGWFSIFQPWTTSCFTNYGYGNYNLYSFGDTYAIDLYLVENDPPDLYDYEVTDDLIATATIYPTTSVGFEESETGSCISVPFQYTFRNVPLSDFAGGTEGQTIEIWTAAAGYPRDNLLHDTDIVEPPGKDSWKSQLYNVNIIDGQCGSGVCCDTSTCNYRTTSYKCEDDVSSVYGCPWGTSPGNDVGVSHQDRYCSGTSSTCSGALQNDNQWSVWDNCNSNEICLAGNPSCQSSLCSSDSDCGIDGYVNEPYCNGDQVWQTYRDYTCHNPGTTSAYCGYLDTEQFKYDCGSETCVSGSCANVNCNNDADCGSAYWGGEPFCQNNDVWDERITPHCANPGLPSAYCWDDYNDQLKQDCADVCANGACTTAQDGYLWYPDYAYYNVRKFSTNGTIMNYFQYRGDGFSGATWDGTYLWLAYDNNILGHTYEDKIYKFTSTGTLVSVIDAPGSDTRDIAWDGSALWVIDDAAFDNKIYRISTSGTVLSVIDSPRDWSSGLAWDGSYLWVSAYGNSGLYQITTSGTIVNQFSGLVNPLLASIEIWGLAWDGASLWAMDYPTQILYKINPNDCTEISHFHSNGYLAKGLAFQPKSQTILCYSETDCGNDSYSGPIFCSDDDLKQNYRDYLCNNPVTYSSYCSITDTPITLQDCGTSTCDSWNPTNYCKNNDVYRSRTCYTKGCTDASCFSNTETQEELVQDCPDTCTNGFCDSVECYSDSECGNDSWVNSPYCSANNNGNVWQDYRIYSCINDGTSSSYCSHTDTPQLKQDCPDDCYLGACASIVCFSKLDCGTDRWIGPAYCNNSDSYDTWRAYTCSNPGTPSSSCSSIDTTQLKQDCPDTCTSGACDEIICYSDSDCDPDSWTGSTFCSGDDVWQNFRDYTCSSPGTHSPSCTFVDTSSLKQDCPDTCTSGVCDAIACYSDSECGTDTWLGSPTCNSGDLWQDYQDYFCLSPGKSNSTCTSSTSSQLKQTCLYGCINDSCVSNLNAALVSPQRDSANVILNPSLIVNVSAASGSDIDVDFFKYNIFDTKTTTGNLWSAAELNEWIFNNTGFGNRAQTFSTISSQQGYFYLNASGGIYYALSTYDYCGGTGCGAFSFIGLYLYNFESGSYDLISQHQGWPTYHWSTTSLVEINMSSVEQKYLIDQETPVVKVKWVMETDDWMTGGFGSSDQLVLLSSPNRSAKPFANNTVITKLIGEENNVPDSSYSSFDWHNLATSRLYSWFVELSQGLDTFTSPVWNFTTHQGICIHANECGTEGLIETPYCSGSDLVQDYISFTCSNPGTSSAYCSNSTTQVLNKTCIGGCDQGNCIACSQDSDCSTDEWITETYCQANEVVRDYRDYSCMNPGTYQSECLYTDTTQLISQCNYSSCEDGACQDVEGFLWLMSMDDRKVSRLTEKGILLNEYQAPIYYPFGIEYDNGNLLTSDLFACDKIIKFPPGGEVSDYIPAAGCPIDTALEGENIWYTHISTGNIIKSSVDGTILATFDPLVNNPVGIAWDGQYIWFGDSVEHKLYKMTTSGEIISSFDSPCMAPISLAWDGKYIWCADYEVHKIYRLTTNGTLVFSFNSPYQYPSGVAWQPVTQTPECDSDSDCASGTISDTWCINNNVWQSRQDAVCKYPETYYATCQQYSELIEECSPGVCLEGECKFSECTYNTDCGMAQWVGSPYCRDNDVWQPFTQPLCVISMPGYNVCTSEEKIFMKADCLGDCKDGICVGITCSSNSDCGTNGWVNSPSCNGTDVWQDYREYKCTNYGEYSSYCNHTDIYKLKSSCTSTCSDGKCTDIECDSDSDCGISAWIGSPSCNSGNVWQQYTEYKCYNKGTIDSYCNSTTANKLKQECTDSCANGICSSPSKCSANTDCGEDKLVGSEYCSGNSVMQKFRTWTCNSPATVDAYCSYKDTEQLKESCSGTCENAICIAPECTTDLECPTDSWIGTPYCKNDEVYQTFRDYSCSGSCVFTDTSTLKQECADTCSSGICVNAEGEGSSSADLKIYGFVKQSPANPSAGDSVVLAFSIENIGSTALSDIEWKLNTGAGASITGSVSSLAPGSDITIFRKFTYNSAGNYYPSVDIDPLNKIDESNKANNHASITLTIN